MTPPGSWQGVQRRTSTGRTEATKASAGGSGEAAGSGAGSAAAGGGASVTRGAPAAGPRVALCVEQERAASTTAATANGLAWA
jgi:hypothetical protein